MELLELYLHPSVALALALESSDGGSPLIDKYL